MRNAIGKIWIVGFVAATLFAGANAANAAALGYGDFVGEFRPVPPEFTKEEMVEGRLGTDLTLVGTWIHGAETGPFDFTITEGGPAAPTGGFWSYVGSHIFEMILTIKYGGKYSAFHYDSVGGGDFGLFSSDPSKTGSPMTIMGAGSPYNIAQIRLYSVGPSPIPVPGGMVLLVSALGALVGFRRLRRSGSATPAIA